MKTPQYSLKDFLEISTAHIISFSPDGNTLLVTSDETGTSQLYLTDRTATQLRQITFFEDSVSFATFSPTKNHILFGKSSGGDENTQLHLYDVETNSFTALTTDPKIRYGFGGWSHDGKRIAFTSNARNGKDFDVYIKDMETNEDTLIYAEGGWNTSFGFSPSGKYLSVGTAISIVVNEVRIIQIDTAEVVISFVSEDEAYSGAPKWLPDETGFYYTSDRGREFLGLAFYEVATRKSHFVYEPNWDVESAILSYDGLHISITINEDGFDMLKVYRTDGFELVKQDAIPVGATYSALWSRDSSYLALNVSSPTSLSRGYVWSLKDDTIAAITSPKSAVPEELYTAPKTIRYTSFDGREIPALVYRPSHTVGEKTPVIINIHGGPEGQSKANFAPTTQYLLQAGFAVIFPNVRGSIGYGRAYTHLDDVEKRMDSVADLAALHAYISEQEQFDSNRVVLLGGSYGGFMVLAGLAFYPHLWAAGVDIVGIGNFITFLENTSPYRRTLREKEYGSLEHNRAFLESASPFNRMKDITAPLFIVHGKNDPRVPLSEAEQLFDGLKAQGNEVALAVYDDEGHGIAKLKNRLDVWPKIVNFLHQHTAQ